MSTISKYLDTIEARVDAIPSIKVDGCEFLQEAIDEIMAELMGMLEGITIQISFIKPLLIVPSLNLVSIVSWIQNLIATFTGPYLKYLQELIEIALRITIILNKLNSKIPELSCNITIPDAIKGAQIDAFIVGGIANMPLDILETVTPEKIASMPNETVSSLSAEQLPALSTEQIQALTISQIPALTVTQLPALGKTQIQALTSTQIQAITAIQTPVFTIIQMGWLLVTQIPHFVQCQAFTSTQINALSVAQISSYTINQVQVFSQAVIENLNSAHLAAIISKLSNFQIPQIAPATLGLLSDSELLQMSLAQRQSLVPAQISALSAHQIEILGL